MMSNISVDFTNSGIAMDEIMVYSNEVEKIHTMLNDKVNDKDEFLGWLNWPSQYDKDEFENVKKCAKKIQSDSDVLLVIGIGGSYLGTRAVIEALTNSFFPTL